ncbi:MAG: hypothetical protein FWH15_04660 [Betaproteobacteria bacterium]|nr:hypothetical protein [Betaproteobacteria bacterium]
MGWTRRLLAATGRSSRTFFAAAFFSLAALFISGCAMLERAEERAGVERHDWGDAAAALVAYQLFSPSGSDLILAGLAYIVVDPQSPNWHITETRLGEDTFYLRATLKRHNKGGEGEAPRLFRRRAEQLQRELGFSGYRLLDYSEGIESRYTGAERYSEGKIQLVRR